MLERLMIQNFQTHDKLRLDFDSGITTIIGPSDVGKSAIIRALRWVCTNTPGGEAFVRHGATGATVRLFVDGHVITRRRGGDVNEYHLDDSRFVAFGRGVPDAIEQLLNIGATGWQMQHDAPYWFADTAGEVSRQLNSIVNLGVIDDALAAVTKTYHKARTRLEVSEENLTKAKQAYDALAWVPGFEAAVTVLEAAQEKYTTAAENASQATQLVEAVYRHEATHEIAIRAAREGGQAVALGTKALTLQKQTATLGRLVDVAREAKAKSDIRVPDINTVEKALTVWQKKHVKAKKLKSALQHTKQAESMLRDAEKELKTAQKSVPKVCPTCGQSLSQTSTSKPARR